MNDDVEILAMTKQVREMDTRILHLFVQQGLGWWAGLAEDDTWADAHPVIGLLLPYFDGGPTADVPDDDTAYELMRVLAKTLAAHTPGVFGAGQEGKA